MKKIRTRALTENQARELKELTALCCSHDSSHLSCPLDGDRFYLLTEDQPGHAGHEALISAAVAFELEGLWECYGFTRPDLRRHGYFSSLLELMEADAAAEEQEPDLCFVADPNGQESLKALEALGAELWYEEHMMEWRVGDDGSAARQVEARSGDAAARRPVDNGPARQDDNRGVLTYSPNALRLTYSPDREGSGRMDFTAWAPGRWAVGSFSLYPQPPAACLFEVEIAEELRRHGLGEAMIRKLQALVPTLGISTITLQVSGDNRPALRLYEKTGFHITETLSYYLY